MRFIPLTKGLWTTVDDEDYERLMVHKWHAEKHGHSFYAVRRVFRSNNARIFMHHEVMDGKPPYGYETDHIDSNGINNQKRNLRNVTRSQNQMNLYHSRGNSQYKGVVWEKSHNKWKAQIGLDGTSTNLGRFDSEEDAARAYDAAASEHFGEFARLNFVVLP